MLTDFNDIWIYASMHILYAYAIYAYVMQLFGYSAASVK